MVSYVMDIVHGRAGCHAYRTRQFLDEFKYFRLNTHLPEGLQQWHAKMLGSSHAFNVCERMGWPVTFDQPNIVRGEE